MRGPFLAQREQYRAISRERGGMTRGAEPPAPFAHFNSGALGVRKRKAPSHWPHHRGEEGAQKLGQLSARSRTPHCVGLRARRLVILREEGEAITRASGETLNVARRCGLIVDKDFADWYPADGLKRRPRRWPGHRAHPDGLAVLNGKSASWRAGGSVLAAGGPDVGEVRLGQSGAGARVTWWPRAWSWRTRSRVLRAGLRRRWCQSAPSSW